MHPIPVRVRFLNRTNINGILISKALADSLELKDNRVITVRLGQRSTTSKILAIDKGENDLWVSQSVREKLAMPFPCELNVKREGDTLRIGPVIGIFTTGIGNSRFGPVTQRSNFFKHLLSAQKGFGVYYFLFSPHDVNWQTRTVNGFFLRPTSNGIGWVKKRIAFPDVIYNRVPNRFSESLESVKRFKEMLKYLPETKMFNPDFFNKWGIHQKVWNNDRINQYIPETHRSPSVKTIHNMLKKYHMVYLKPSGGSLGLGIIKVTYKPFAGFFARYNRNGHNVLVRFNSVHALVGHLLRSGFKLSNYLVQQGIRLVRIDGRPIDFRVHLHKNKQNEWIVSAIAAKVAGHGCVTTHVRTGGTVLSHRQALEYVFGQSAVVIEDNMKQATIQIAEAIEEAVGHPLGEIGFDIGVDINGHVWMFEANSKPGRHIFAHKSLREADRQSTRLLVEYGSYLADFT